MNTSPSNLALGVQVETVNPQELFQVLAAACSSNQPQIMAAGQRLKEMLEMFGTYNELHRIAAQRDIAPAIRKQAIIQFKLNATFHWKSRKLLNDAHRNEIRARTMTFLDEPDDSLAKFNTAIVAKLARHDFPANWPSLFKDLLGTIDHTLRQRYEGNSPDSQQTLMLRRSLQLVNSTLKELAGIKMLGGVKNMAKIANEIKDVLVNYYTIVAPRFTQVALESSPEPSRLEEDVAIAQLIFKCVAKLGVWQWNRIDREKDDQSLVNWTEKLVDYSTQQVQNVTAVRKSLIRAQQQNPAMGAYQPVVKILTKHLLTFGKLFRRIQQLSRERFAALPTCENLVLFYWSEVDAASEGPSDMIKDSDEVLYPLRFLVQGMVLFKDNLPQWSVQRRDGTLNKNSLSRGFVETAVHLLVTRFMPLNPSDLEEWMADPEEWLNEEDRDNEQWEFEIRACSERVLMQLCEKFPDVVTPLLMTTFQTVVSQTSDSLDAILLREALYCAIGRCAIRLRDQLPFNEWLEGSLAAETRSQNPSYPIIKRRIAWVIGQWVSLQCASPNNARIWEILVFLLKDRGPGSDTVVRLTATTALGQCIDTLEFEPDTFVQYLPEAVTQLTGLIAEAESSDSKRRVAKTLTALMEQTGSRVTPFMMNIAAPLPNIWQSAGEDFILKGTLLLLVAKLVDSVREQSGALNALTIPLVRESTQPHMMTHLDEDALQLWLAVVRNATSLINPTGGPSLRDVFPRVLELLATNLDLLAKLTEIFDGYLILDSPGLLQLSPVPIFQVVVQVIDSKAIGINVKYLLLAIEDLVQNAPSSLWGEPMHTSGLFQRLLDILVENESHQLTLTGIIYLFSRIVMADKQIFIQLMSAQAGGDPQREYKLYDGLMDQWWGKFDNMSEPRHRKLTAMGVAALVSTGHPEVLKRLPGEIFNIWMDVFGEIKETRDAHADDSTNLDMVSPTNLRRHWELDEAPLEYYQESEGTVEYDRRRAMYERDPIRSAPLNAYVAERLAEAERVSGPVFNQYIQQADETVLRQIQAELAKR